MTSDPQVSLAFEVDQFSDVREGYVSLEWNDVDAAAAYSVTDYGGVEVFRGSRPQAFVSGLSDGDHAFSVTAVDATGNAIARSLTPATVTVNHWPLGLAIALFLCGLLVFLSLIGVLVTGIRRGSSKAQT